MIMLPLVPHSGIGPFKLGASRPAIRAAAAGLGLSAAGTHEESDYFAEESVQVDYDAGGRAQFVGVSPPVDLFRATYEGLDVSDTPAEELFVRIAAGEGGGDHAFDPEGYLFPRQIVVLWAADDQNDLLRRRAGAAPRLIWGQVGLGTPAYRQQVERIRARDT
jgi:hypothetical protein